MKIIKSIFRPDPRYLYLEPVFGCNYRCFFCIHGRGFRIERKQLDPIIFNKLKPIIENVEYVHMSGLGEPFLNDNLVNYLLHFREINKRYYICSNGSLIKDRHIDVMATSRSELSISLDAGDNETYKKVRHPRNWDRIISTLQKISEIKAQSKSPYPLIYLTFNINRSNLMSLKNLPDLCRELAINAVRFSWTMLPKDYKKYSIFNNETTTTQIIEDVSNQLQKSGIQVRNGAVFQEYTRGCWNLSQFTFIGANGAVAACCSRWITIGSLFENPFEDIWNSMAHRRLSFGIFYNRPIERCKTCQQIHPVNFQGCEDDFFKEQDADKALLEEKTKKVEKLPSLNGLNIAFQSGVEAIIYKDFHKALDIFSQLENKFPEFYEIKNNLAVAHYYLGNIEKCIEIFQSIKKLPHNEKFINQNLEKLQDIVSQ